MYIIEETDDRFYVKKSTLPNAGFGCFAKVPIKKGDYLEVIGVLVRAGTVADRCTHYANRYKFGAKEGYHIVPMGYGGIVNQANSEEQQNVQLQRIKLMHRKRSQHASEIVYTAIRDIEPDEELLGHYGGNYGNELDWVAQMNDLFDENNDDWKVFLAYDLYNLGVLQDSL
jgi:SET domain-containing protein